MTEILWDPLDLQKDPLYMSAPVTPCKKIASHKPRRCIVGFVDNQKQKEALEWLLI